MTDEPVTGLDPEERVVDADAVAALPDPLAETYDRVMDGTPHNMRRAGDSLRSFVAAYHPDRVTFTRDVETAEGETLPVTFEVAPGDDEVRVGAGEDADPVPPGDLDRDLSDAEPRFERHDWDGAPAPEPVTVESTTVVDRLVVGALEAVGVDTRDGAGRRTTPVTPANRPVPETDGRKRVVPDDRLADLPGPVREAYEETMERTVDPASERSPPREEPGVARTETEVNRRPERPVGQFAAARSRVEFEATLDAPDREPVTVGLAVTPGEDVAVDVEEGFDGDWEGYRPRAGEDRTLRFRRDDGQLASIQADSPERTTLRDRAAAVVEGLTRAEAVEEEAEAHRTVDIGADAEYVVPESVVAGWDDEEVAELVDEVRAAAGDPFESRWDGELPEELRAGGDGWEPSLDEDVETVHDIEPDRDEDAEGRAVETEPDLDPA